MGAMQLVPLRGKDALHHWLGEVVLEEGLPESGGRLTSAFGFSAFYKSLMTTSTWVEQSTELAERELALEATRSERLLGARSLIKDAFLSVVEREVRVFEEYHDLDGRRRYRPVWRTRTFVLNV